MAMIIRCANGHFYDAEKTGECPYCMNSDEKQEHVFVDRSSLPKQERSGLWDDGITEAASSQGSVFISGSRPDPIQGMASREDVTIGLFSSAIGRGYVTGWLVGVKGPALGRDYRIHHGINWVGSGYNANIIIGEDSSIASEKHCGVVYDGANIDFYLIPGQGTNTYLNGQLLTSERKLYLGDAIVIGASTFEFIPYCREGHTWGTDMP